MLLDFDGLMGNWASAGNTCLRRWVLVTPAAIFNWSFSRSLLQSVPELLRICFLPW